MVVLIVVATQLAVMTVGDVRRDSLRREIMAAIAEADESGQPVRLASATSFDWNEAYLFGRYTDGASIRRTLGYPWRAADREAPAFHDSYSLLVFVRSGMVVQHVQIRRTDIEFVGGVRAARFTRDNAVFTVTESPRSWPLYWLKHAAGSDAK